MIKRRYFLVLILLMVAGGCAWAEEVDTVRARTAPVSAEIDRKSLADGWFVQVGGDWTLQRPYGYPLKGTVTEGSTLGIDAAFGRWFTHEIGLRAKCNWENGIINTNASWLAPFEGPGSNYRKHGYLSITGDILLDLRNIAVGYNEKAVWNPQLILRAGGVYNFGCNKGAPLVGVGIGNTFRINRNWGIYADIAYNAVSSGFTMDASAATGMGVSANAYVTMDVGATYSFRSDHATKQRDFPSVIKGGSFWRRWFVQLGADMTLYNPCEMDFREVFPKGVAMGLDVSVGKWFSPEIGLRGRVNLENMLVENKKLVWVGWDPNKYSSNFDGHGCVMVYGDVMVSLKHMFITGWDEFERWDWYGFGRLGLSCNLAVGSCSPVVGIGTGVNVRLYKYLSLYMDTCYEGTTTEFFSYVGSWSGATGARFNGIWDVNLGLQVDIPCRK